MFRRVAPNVPGTSFRTARMSSARSEPKIALNSSRVKDIPLAVSPLMTRSRSSGGGCSSAAKGDDPEVTSRANEREHALEIGRSTVWWDVVEAARVVDEFEQTRWERISQHVNQGERHSVGHARPDLLEQRCGDVDADHGGALVPQPSAVPTAPASDVENSSAS